MEQWLSTDELLQKQIFSETNLIYLVKTGYLTAYDKENFTPFDWTNLEKQFRDLGEALKKIHKEPSWILGRGRISLGGNHKGPPPPDIEGKIPFKTLLRMATVKSPFNISWEQYTEIKEGWSSTQIQECLQDAIFIESDIETLTKETNTNGHTIQAQQHVEDIGDSERLTLIKIITLLSHILALEWKGDPDCDILSKKGPLKINPEKLAKILKERSLELFPESKDPSHRLGKTKLREILKAAEEKLEPDTTAFLSTQE